ncbi:tyrosine-type recombinase/integrase [Erythrobacter sp. EC-HK427]|uniref:tyrosine-type recombinase/integrase n=1 Tax=Erythrobacter sp. EC-HK427 TaxID=2038396 RepID=UPI001252AB1B|nr:site-specific integrase [Erythrobacter sp. EC-HK427]VVT18080.1 Phage integrase family protein [Erythrobacter sp. EC-HK427]
MTAIRKREWVSPKGQKKTAWLVDYKDQHGKRRARQFPTKKEAEYYADRARNEIRQGRHTHDRDSITVAVAADLWIAAGDANGLERSTIKRYRELSNLHIVPKLGALKLSQLTKAQVIEWRQELLTVKSRSMASKIIRALSAILSNAMEIGAISQNVASDVKVGRAKRDAERVEPPARADLKKMIEAATDDERPFILTAITTGLRSSELRGLCWRDIDLNAGTLTVRQRADQWGVLGSPKSEAGRRTIPLPPQLVVELTRWKLRCKPTTIGLVFPSSAGTALRHNNVLRRMYFPLQVRAGLAVPKLDANGRPLLDDEGNPIVTGKYRFHALRHAAASGWIANKIDLKRLQVWIGHESIQLTLDTYGHLLADQERDAELAMLASRDLFG